MRTSTDKKRETSETSGNATKKQKTNKYESSTDNILMVLIKSGAMKSTLFEPKYFRNTFSLINRSVFNLVKHQIAKETFIMLGSIKNLRHHLILYPHEYVGIDIDADVSSLKLMEDKFPFIRTMDIDIKDYTCKKLLSINNNQWPHLERLIIRRNADLIDFDSLAPTIKTIVLSKENETAQPPHDFLIRLPRSVETIATDMEFDGDLKCNAHIKTLFMSGPIDQRRYRHDSVADSVQHLLLGSSWYEDSIFQCGPNITHLLLGNDFNGNVDALKDTKITHLTFGHLFNRPVDNLPTGLLAVKFGAYFNQTIDNLPDSLLSLKTGQSFNKSIDKIPFSVRYLYLKSRHFKQKPLNVWPPLIYLEMYTPHCTAEMSQLPMSLVVIKLKKSDIVNPGYRFKDMKQLKYLQLTGNYAVELSNNIPEKLEVLNLPDSYSGGLKFLPKSLKQLRVGKNFKGRINFNAGAEELHIYAHPESIIAQGCINKRHAYGADVVVSVTEDFWEVPTYQFDFVKLFWRRALDKKHTTFEVPLPTLELDGKPYQLD